MSSLLACSGVYEEWGIPKALAGWYLVTFACEQNEYPLSRGPWPYMVSQILLLPHGSTQEHVIHDIAKQTLRNVFGCSDTKILESTKRKICKGLVQKAFHPRAGVVTDRFNEPYTGWAICIKSKRSKL